jgi:undecaprenyl-diphosphatase
MISYFEALLLGIIEGLTEFLPISSTAHLLVSEKLLHVPTGHFVNFYTIFIQLGAILAVPMLYFKRLIKSFKIYFLILFSFIPAAIFGVLLDDFLETLFAGYWYIVLSWFLGGIVLLKIDSWLNPTSSYTELEESLNPSKAIKIGLFQCLAMIPGVSRSGATIIGGRIQGLSHKNAVEFSFLLAIPTILGASFKKIIDYKDEIPTFIQIDNLISLSIGFVVSFIVALLTIRWMVNFISKKGFVFFGYYRIATAILLTIYLLWS